uniref:Uncharacterized protein n=1 Tax=Romanomermis culicivorax TaxID=13658 RepID=A0A915JRZ2_ROMCU
MYDGYLLATFSILLRQNWVSGKENKVRCLKIDHYLRGPSKSKTRPLRKIFIVGKPLTPYFVAKSFSTVASTLARNMGNGESERRLAAFSYSGANFLQ